MICSLNATHNQLHRTGWVFVVNLETTKAKELKNEIRGNTDWSVTTALAFSLSKEKNYIVIDGHNSLWVKADPSWQGSTVPLALLGLNRLLIDHNLNVVTMKKVKDAEKRLYQ